MGALSLAKTAVDDDGAKKRRRKTDWKAHLIRFVVGGVSTVLTQKLVEHEGWLKKK